MTHRIWARYFPGSGFAFAEEQKGLSYQQTRQILLGQPLDQPLPEVVISELSPGRLPDMLGAAWPSYMVAANLREVLEECRSDGIQWIPVELLKYPGAEYSIANVLTQIECLDRERSDLEAFAEPPYAIHTLRKLVLKPIPESAPPIFHVAELPAAILVRQDLQRRMEAVSSSPGRFIPIEDYTI